MTSFQGHWNFPRTWNVSGGGKSGPYYFRDFKEKKGGLPPPAPASHCVISILQLRKPRLKGSHVPKTAEKYPQFSFQGPGWTQTLG